MRALESIVYEIDSAVDEAVLATAIETRLGVHELEPAERTVTFYDTFDWRLWRRRRLLRAQELEDGREPGTSLELRDLEGSLVFRLPGHPMPLFAADLPPGPLRDALTAVCTIRRLLPVVRLRCRRRCWSLIDERGKTLLRLFLDRCDARPGGGGRGRSLAPVLRVESVRGYDAAYEWVLEELEALPYLHRRETDDLSAALTALGRRPADYSSRIELHLEPRMRADDALKEVLGALLRAVKRNENGTRRDLDPEFLHDLRVAVRRGRSALGQVPGVLPQKSVDALKRELAWLGKVTGPTRDLDVYRLKLEGYRRQLPVTSDLEPLEVYLERHRSEEQRRLAEILAGARYRRLLELWQSFVERPSPARTALPDAQRPILEVAAARVRKAWRRILEDGSAIGPDTPADALHRLRIDCKKLRYLLELFRSLFPQEEVGKLVQALKRLQDNLGDFNDLEVQQQTLPRFAEGMAEEGVAPVATLLAMGRLVERLAVAQEQERRRFQKRFVRLAAGANRRRFKALFGAKAVASRLAALEGEP